MAIKKDFTHEKFKHTFRNAYFKAEFAETANGLAARVAVYASREARDAGGEPLAFFPWEEFGAEAKKKNPRGPMTYEQMEQAVRQKVERAKAKPFLPVGPQPEPYTEEDAARELALMEVAVGTVTLPAYADIIDRAKDEQDPVKLLKKAAYKGLKQLPQFQGGEDV